MGALGGDGDVTAPLYDNTTSPPASVCACDELSNTTAGTVGSQRGVGRRSRGCRVPTFPPQVEVDPKSDDHDEYNDINTAEIAAHDGGRIRTAAPGG